MILGSLSCTELSTLLLFWVWKIRPKWDKILTAHALLPHWMWTVIRQNWQQILLNQFSFHFIDNVPSRSCFVWDPHSSGTPVASFFECLIPYVYTTVSKQPEWGPLKVWDIQQHICLLRNRSNKMKVGLREHHCGALWSSCRLSKTWEMDTTENNKEPLALSGHSRVFSQNRLLQKHIIFSHL